MMTNMIKHAGFGLVVLLFLGLFACSEPQQDDANAQTGTIALLLTDAPTQTFSEINLTVSQISVIGGENNGTVLFDGEQTVDLLKLEEFSTIFSLTEVPAGTYHKLRLILKNPDGLELVRKDDGMLFYPRLPGNGKIDLLARGGLEVAAGETLVVKLDVDANKSILITETGNVERYNFRPVVFLDTGMDMSRELVRAEGQLCQLEPVVLLCPAADEGAQIESYTLALDDASVLTPDGVFIETSELTLNEDVIVFGYAGDDDNPMVLETLLVEQGLANQFDNLSGTVVPGSQSDSGFELALADESVLTVTVSPQTQFITQSGGPSGLDQLLDDEMVHVEGTLPTAEAIMVAGLIMDNLMPEEPAEPANEE